MSCATELQAHQSEYAEILGNCHKINLASECKTRSFLPKAVRPHANNPFTMTMGSALRNATFTLKEQMSPMLIHDKKIPEALLSQAEGFMFLTFVRLGFLGGARFGSGLVVAKREDGTWSAPSAVGMGGLSVGFMAGGDVVNMCLVMMSKRLVEVLSEKGQLSFDGEFGVSVGPVGRTGSAGFNVSSNGVAPMYSYCQSRGLFAGVEVNGSVIVSRKSVNHRFYGVDYEPEELLLGQVARPDAGHEFYEALMQATAPQDLPSRFSTEDNPNLAFESQAIQA
jgi:lipid-binding SYLF domain-containing protein